MTCALRGARRGRFNHVRIDRALRQPLRALDLGGLFLEHLDEHACPMILRFFSGIGLALQRIQKTALGVHADHLHAHVLGEGRHHLIAFVEAQQAVVHENAGELLADGAMQQRRHHGRIHAAGQTEHHLVLANLLRTDATMLDDVARRPQRLAAADVVHETLQDGGTLGGVRDLGMELHAIEAARLVGDTSKRRVLGLGNHLEAGRQFGHAIAVTHPHMQEFLTVVGRFIANALEQLRMTAHAHARVAELAFVRTLHFSA